MRKYAAIIQRIDEVIVEKTLKEDKNYISAIVQTIKEDSNLSKLHKIVYNLERTDLTEKYVDSYLQEHINFSRKRKWDFSKYKPIMESVKTQDPLNEAIGIILFEKKTISNVEEYLNAYDFVRNHLISEETSKREIAPLERQIKESLDNLDEVERAVIEQTLENDGSLENVYYNLMKECIELSTAGINKGGEDYKKLTALHEIRYNLQNSLMEFDSKKGAIEVTPSQISVLTDIKKQLL